ncbi:MAG: hypothetical protein Q4B94_00155 [Pseudomonadota bacterium]|nr:hypothetical protein [Pseudomonadota bacterium]
MRKHIHAEEMLEYAQDAQMTDKPWEWWELFIPADEYGDDRWTPLQTHPTWARHHKYRRKPRTININGYSVPEPVRRPLKDGDKYYVPALFEAVLADYYYWGDAIDGDEVDRRLLERGLVHMTAEAAVVHAKALLSFTAEPEVGNE